MIDTQYPTMEAAREIEKLSDFILILNVVRFTKRLCSDKRMEFFKWN